MGLRLEAHLFSGRAAPTRRGFDSQYVSSLLSKTMREHGIRPSIGSISSPWDNAAMESLMDLVSRRACTGLCHARRGGAGSVRVHRGHIQQGQDAYDTGRSGPRRVRKGQSAGRRKPSEGGAEGVNGIGADSDSWSWSSSSFSRLEASSRARPRAAPGAVAAVISCRSSTRCRRPLTPSKPGASFRACTSRSLPTR